VWSSQAARVIAEGRLGDAQALIGEATLTRAGFEEFSAAVQVRFLEAALGRLTRGLDANLDSRALRLSLAPWATRITPEPAYAPPPAPA
jgi:hypothetical protein